MAEVSVPYTDAYIDPSFDSRVVIYRLYYETTHWVDKLVWDGAGNAWYRFYDDKRKVSYYAPATHLANDHGWRDRSHLTEMWIPTKSC